MSAVIPRLRDSYKKSDRRKEKQKLYNDTIYKKERDWYMQCKPICECCERDGLITPSKDLHHIMSPHEIGISKEEAYRRLRDEKNFLAVCQFHHLLCHGLAPQSMIDEYNQRKQNKLKKDE